MAKIDKEMFDKIGFKPGCATYVPISNKVAKILKRKKGEAVLVAYVLHPIYTKNKEDTNMLVYHEYKDGIMYRPAGYSGSNFPFEKIAESIAQSWPEYAVKHRKSEE